MKPVSLVSLPLLLAGAFACDVDAGVAPAVDAEFRGQPLACPKCQFNAAQIGHTPFSHLDLTGAPNEHGVAARYLVDPSGQRHTLGIRSEEFAAYDGKHLVASGSGLIGWRILVEIDGDPRSVQIVGRALQASLAADTKPISVYALTTKGADDQLVNLCPGFKPSTPALTIVHGETYDHEFKEIDQVGPQWVTLACADEAVFKIKRFSYGPNGNQGPGGGPATPEQRTAALKMVTADYCGTGHSFTADDTAVLWMNAIGTVKYTDLNQTVGIEAFWDENGALCLDAPRHATLAEVLAVCDLPSCAVSPEVAWEWRSFVPKQILP